MPDQVREIMTADPATIETDGSAQQAATLMRDNDAGAVIVVGDGEVKGIVTDRDIAIRAVAEGRDASKLKVDEIFSPDPTVLRPEDSVNDAVTRIREKKVRRLPVVEDGNPVGIVSLGDLAVERDPSSALGGISAAPPNN